MGNLHCCQSFVRPPSPEELTFHQENICAKGMILQQTVIYLSKQELELFKLASGCNTVAFMLTLKDRSNALITDLNRTSLLHCASRSGSPEMIQMLVQQGLDVNLGDASGWTPMHVAVEFQREDNLKALIKLHANPYIKNKSNYTCYQLFENPILKEIATQKIISQRGLDTLLEARDFRSIRQIYKKTVETSFSDEVSIEQRIEISVSAETQQKVLQDRKEIAAVSFSKTLLSINKQTQIPLSVEVVQFLMSKNPTLASKYFNLTSCNTPTKISWYLVENAGKIGKHLFNFLTNFQIQLTWETCFEFMHNLMNLEESLVENINRIFSNIHIQENYFQANFLSQIFARVYFQKEPKLTQIQQLQKVVFNILLITNKSIFKKVSEEQALIVSIKKHMSVLDLSSNSIEQVLDYCKKSKVRKISQVKKYESPYQKTKWRQGYVSDYGELLVYISNQISLMVSTGKKSEYRVYNLSKPMSNSIQTIKTQPSGC